MIKRFAVMALCVAFAICGVCGNDGAQDSVKSAKDAIQKARDEYSTALKGYFDSSITFVTLQKGLDERVAKISEVAKASKSGAEQGQKVSSIMQKVQAIEVELMEANDELQKAGANKNAQSKYIALKDKFVELSTKSTAQINQSKATLDNAIAVFRKYMN